MQETLGEKILRILDASMETPGLYGWFHLLSFAIALGAAALLCRLHRNASADRVSRTVLITSLITLLLEIYKQINYNFTYGTGQGVGFDMQWYAFPWQFCTTPMYVGILAGLTRRGKVHDACCAYLATYSVFAGACVMFYPGDVFIRTIGINIQTMFCHGSMLTLGIYLYVTGHVKLEHRTILRALPIFLICVGVAIIMNETANATGLLEEHNFNMFYISPYCDPHLPVYSIVQEHVPYPFCLILYILGFSAASWIILLAAMGVGKLVRKLRAKPTVAA